MAKCTVGAQMDANVLLASLTQYGFAMHQVAVQASWFTVNGIVYKLLTDQKW